MSVELALIIGYVCLSLLILAMDHQIRKLKRQVDIEKKKNHQLQMTIQILRPIERGAGDDYPIIDLNK